MAEFEAPAVRYAAIRHGDNIRGIALRELGDAAKWTDLVILNGLRPPYIADEAGAGILAYGDEIMIPAPGSGISAETDAVGLFGVDLKVTGKRLEAANGDFAIISGVSNLSQALTHHVVVGKRELAFHPEFGCWVRELIGEANGASAGQLAALYVQSALLEDERVQDVPTCTATIAGDQINVVAVVTPITGNPVELRATF